MIKVGITGQNGFIGQHLTRHLSLKPERYQVVPFDKSYFFNEDTLDSFTTSCDVIVHLAALNRHEDVNIIYDTNVSLVDALIRSLKRTKASPHVIYSSSTQEMQDNLYGKSKRLARESLAKWASDNRVTFTGAIIPNVFGPFGNPYYNSVVATFCYQLTHGEKPVIKQDAKLSLVYVDNVISKIIDAIENNTQDPAYHISADNEISVSSILGILSSYKETYFDKGQIPDINKLFDQYLFNTFRSYIDIDTFFPFSYKKNEDERGNFVELVRLGSGGQISFSTTKPGITRGNHFHTRKIERFAVIKGKARIDMRKIGDDDVHQFFVDGEHPAFVDMPIWYTHNITNVGETELYTIYWINEPYNPDDSDTYFEKV